MQLEVERLMNVDNFPILAEMWQLYFV